MALKGRIHKMQKIEMGQFLLILCCVSYLVWWYRGFRPDVEVSRTSGIGGILLLVTAVLGIAGVFFSLSPVMEKTAAKLNPMHIAAAGILGYIILLWITRTVFDRVVTSELLLIVGWTVLELTVINRLNAALFLSDSSFFVMGIVIAAAFAISMVLYVAYYRIEEWKAFYAAMVPLLTEAATMTVLVVLLYLEK